MSNRRTILGDTATSEPSSVSDPCPCSSRESGGVNQRSIAGHLVVVWRGSIPQLELSRLEELPRQPPEGPWDVVVRSSDFHLWGQGPQIPGEQIPACLDDM